jgi:hypothetical protein
MLKLVPIFTRFPLSYQKNGPDRSPLLPLSPGLNFPSQTLSMLKNQISKWNRNKSETLRLRGQQFLCEELEKLQKVLSEDEL